MINYIFQIDIATMVGILGVLLSTSGFVSQIVKILRTKSVEDLSIYLFGYSMCQAIVWIVYFTLSENFMGVVENIIWSSFCLIIIGLKFYYSSRTTIETKKIKVKQSNVQPTTDS